ncbi:LolA family protein [Chitinophaga deserti]|uniref:LolA family protein n=1 Tax=Chitinophaga deserti TaxID=2164099 RepID=UPI000D6B78AD|nr:hypothetical protein [Chitinophaga deserti]
MKRFLGLAITIALSGAAISSQAQTADEIIAKHQAAMGGDAKLKSLKSLYSEGTMSVQGMDFPFKITVLSNTAMRVEFEAMGTTNIQVATPTGGWFLLPVQQQTEPVDANPDDMKDIGSELDLEGELVDAKAKGHTVELVGKDASDGPEQYKFKLTRKNGSVAHYFIDPATFFITKRVTTGNVQGQEMTLVTKLSDYKKTSDGYSYAAKIEQSPMETVVVLTKVTANPPVPDSTFQKPAAK